MSDSSTSAAAVVTKGCNKSAMAMQWGASLCLDKSSFLDFKIQKKGLSVLYIDTEIGKDLVLERREMLQKNFPEWSDDTNRRFNMISLDAGSDDKTELFNICNSALLPH